MPIGICTNAEAQYGAYSQNGGNGALRRCAQAELPHMQASSSSHAA